MKYAIIAEGRCGSTLLTQAFQDAGEKFSNEVLCFDSEKYLHPELKSYINNLGFDISRETQADIDSRTKITSAEYLDLAYSLYDGIKFIFYQMDKKWGVDFIEYFNTRGIRPVVLYRDNTLQIYQC